MPWVRLDDQFPIHRKIAALSDPAFRLHCAALAWCARNLTDGFVSTGELDQVCAQVRAPVRFATELADRKVWHPAGYPCPSKHCPAAPTDGNGKPAAGWVIHDYLEYQQPRSKVLHIRAQRAIAGAEGGRRSGESRNRSPKATRSKNEANAKQVASPPVEPRPGPLRGHGAGGPPPSSGSAAYGDRATPDGIAPPSNGGGPPAPHNQNPAQPAEHLDIRERLRRNQEKFRAGQPYQPPPDLDEKG